MWGNDYEFERWFCVQGTEVLSLTQEQSTNARFPSKRTLQSADDVTSQTSHHLSHRSGVSNLFKRLS